MAWHTWGVLEGGSTRCRRAGTQAGGTQPRGVCLPQAQKFFPNSPEELRSPMNIPIPVVGETRQHCCLDMASSLWAGNRAHSRRPEQASHWEAFPVYEWLPLG